MTTPHLIKLKVSQVLSLFQAHKALDQANLASGKTRWNLARNLSRLSDLGTAINDVRREYQKDAATFAEKWEDYLATECPEEIKLLSVTYSSLNPDANQISPTVLAIFDQVGMIEDDSDKIVQLPDAIESGIDSFKAALARGETGKAQADELIGALARFTNPAQGKELAPAIVEAGSP